MSQAGNFFVSGGGGGGGVTSVETDFGTATPAAGILNIIADTPTRHAGSSVSFSGSGNTVLFNVTDAGINTIIGRDSGNLTMAGQFNTIFGVSCGGALTNGSNNVMMGIGALDNITTGSRNVVLGTSTGDFYSSNESDNILIGYNVDGLNGESHVLRIGSGTGSGSGELQLAFICGIDNVDVGSVVRIVTENADQLGTADLVAGSGITITPGPNTITIESSGGGGGLTDIATDDGTATQAGGIINLVAENGTNNCGATVLFSGATDTVVLNVTDASFNTIIGKGSGNSTMTTTDNVIIGGTSGSSLTNGSTNVSLGQGNMAFLTTGDRNVFIGGTTAGNYTGDESGNILIGYDVEGVNGESNTLRIGKDNTSINRAFICGIDNVDVGSVVRVVTENTDQLGTADLVAGSGITITPGSNTITIESSAPVAFITTVSTTINNVTGDGTSYTVVYDNVISDTNGAYNNATGIFTAPSSGFYQLSASVCAQGLTAAHDYEMRIDSDDASQELEGSYLVAGLVATGGIYNGSVSGLMNLSAGDEVFVTFVSSGGAKVVDVFNVYSWFNGFKIG